MKAEIDPQIHIRQVNNGYIASIVTAKKFEEEVDRYGNSRSVPAIYNEEIVFESLEALCVFLIFHFEQDKLNEIVEAHVKQGKSITFAEAYDEFTEHQGDARNYLYKENYSKVFLNSDKKKF